jgi:uncharacterized protein YndB with AHSA1/START domain
MMPVKHDASGRRHVQAEVEVPGTPEQVWEAIATGPGISSWFVPTDVEERDGGAVAFHLGAGMDSHGHVTVWQPPRRFAIEEREWAPGSPPLATEFTIEARAGGTCVVRLVHSLFASGEDWDDQLESMESGWVPFFEVLRLYLDRFSGQPCSSIRVMGTAAVPEAQAWDALTRALGFAGATAGQRRGRPEPGVPPLDGTVHRVGSGTLREMIVTLDQPAAGVGALAVATWGGQVVVTVSLYLYGEPATGVAMRDEPRWRAWMEDAFSTARHGLTERSCS